MFHTVFCISAALCPCEGYKPRVLTIWAVKILAVLQSVVVHLAANHGLGRHTKNLNAHNYAYYSKVRPCCRALGSKSTLMASPDLSSQAIYTSQILKILIHYLAKLSLILVFLRLTPARGMRRVLWLFGLIITLWAGTAMVTHSVQCPLPTPWKLSAPGCYNQVIVPRPLNKRTC